MFYHVERNIRTVIHGDDFTLLGFEKDLMWFRTMISKKFQVKFRGMIGPDARDEKVMIILNRRIEWTDRGIEYQADPRHVEII